LYRTTNLDRKSIKVPSSVLMHKTKLVDSWTICSLLHYLSQMDIFSISFVLFFTNACVHDPHL
jgi:hypothetical protein